MSTSTHRVDVESPRHLGAAPLALVLAVLSVPGSLLPWDWFALGGLAIGVPLALAAIVVGVRAHGAEAAPPATSRIVLAAIVLGVVALCIPIAWTVASVAG